jgi:hypothetical protein
MALFSRVEKEYKNVPGFADPEHRNQVIAKRLAEALHEWLKKHDPQNSLDSKNPACRVNHGWAVMWKAVDEQQKGYLALKDFDYMCGVDMLNVKKDVQPHSQMDHLDEFWRDIVAASTGPFHKVSPDTVPWADFALGLYRIYLRSWPRLPAQRLRQLARKITQRAEKVHGFTGNWKPVLENYDFDGTDTMTFNKLHAMIRKPFPGFGFSKDEFTDIDIRSVWRESDENEDGDGPLADFGAFLRINAAVPAVSESDVRLSKEQVRSILDRLNDGIRKWQVKRGVTIEQGKSSFADMNLQWCVLFHLSKESASRNMDVAEFKYAITHVAKIKNVSDGEVEGLFQILDLDGSGQLTYEEFALAYYRQETIWWPTLHEVELRKAAAVLNNAAVVWTYANNKKKMGPISMSWFKVLEAQNVDGTVEREHDQLVQGKFQFNEFMGLIRGSFPGLAVSRYSLSDNQVRGLWKAIDSDRISKVPTSKIAVFLRNWAKDDSSAAPASQASPPSSPTSPACRGTTTLTAPRSARNAKTIPSRNYRQTSLRTFQAREEGWNRHCVPSASGVLHHDDSLRHDFYSGGYGTAHSTKSKYGYGGVSELV